MLGNAYNIESIYEYKKKIIWTGQFNKEINFKNPIETLFNFHINVI